ncbi:hypothetical protein RM549_06130 [Salegentibacter sp. F188]|uniref:Uncharacterized protein n=1 Tax=Autumnicola patrickiae TaxID=3075591 RepID=A0ABU3E066_9FLAO|nr:hypothetical protein [Salegentibacter sp. F188]MDT0689355.1 hypothetical protein [Salegentibacter sp. F188]
MSFNSKKCRCGSSRNIYCSNCSKISMCILLKNGNDHLKLTNGRGRKVSPVWYSPIKENRKPERDIIEGMLSRFAASPFVNVTQQVNFYINNTTNLIFSYTL